MLRYLYHPDAGIVVLNVVFTAGSMALSAYCGWLLATGQGEIIQWACAIMFSGFAFGLGLAVSRRERYRLAKDRAGHDRWSIATALFVLANALTGFSAGSAIRDLSVTQSDNENTNARKEVMRIESRIAQLTSDGTITLRPSKFYDAQVAAKTEELRQESLKGCRKPPCKGPNYLKDMEEIASLTDLASTSKELEQLRTALPAAKADVKEAPKAANPALAPIIKLLQIVTGTLDNSDADKAWGLNYFVLASTLIFTGGIYYFSAELGVRAGPMSAPIPRQEWRPAPRQRRLDAPEGSVANPIPLRSEPASGSNSLTVNYATRQGADVNALDRIMKDLEDEFGLKPTSRN